MVQITQLDSIPLPTERLSEERPAERVVRDHPAWPRQELRLYFDYNNAAEAWVWHADRQPDSPDGEPTKIIERQPLTYGVPYQFEQIIGFTAIDFRRTADRVTPRTLGDEVELIAYPGPQSPGWEDWLERQRTDESPEDELGLSVPV